ncbi:MAG: glucose-6-phosphate dehydrogenase [Bacilli bacterium]|nr:glucose-6-phosphate dehydrogenase [Bacilli bacterium]
MHNVTYTIFGGTGDLTFRKLLPALYNLFADHKLEDSAQIVIIGRRAYTNATYSEEAKKWVQQFARLPYREDMYAQFITHIHYQQMDFTKEEEYLKLNAFYLNHAFVNHIFYFAVAPRFFAKIAQGLHHVQDAQNGKVIIEKPFGENLDSARELNYNLENFFQKEHIFHIDHYLGKEMVRNMQIIRFMNPMFQDVWNAKYIEKVDIHAFESVGVESRGDYYDQSGALKDMVQNHLFQILSIVAMEQPDAFFKEDMHRKQLEVFHSLRPVKELDMKHDVVLGQYFNYQKEDRVKNDSMTETYVALRLYIDNARWQNVPFIIKTGKKLNRREMEVVITFKKTNPDAFANVLTIKIQPTEGVYFQFNIKKPGDSDEIELTTMDFCQSCSDINRINTPEAYERLLLAAVQKDTSWFSMWDQIEASWEYVEEIKKRYKEEGLPLYNYMAQSDGPEGIL